MQPQNRSLRAWCPLQGQLARICVPLQMASSATAPTLRVKGGTIEAREGFTRTFPNAYGQVHFSGKYRQVTEERNRKSGGRTYPACLAEPTLKERVEGHRIFPTTGQTAICKKDMDSSWHLWS